MDSCVEHRTAIPRRKVFSEEVDATNVYVADVVKEHRKESSFRRPEFCVDTGAPSSAIGLKELRRLSSNFASHLLRLKKSHKQFRFADAPFTSLGGVSIPLGAPPGVRPVFVTLEVVSADVPTLLGMDVLDAECLVADTFSNRLKKRIVLQNIEGENGTKLDEVAVDEWSIPLSRYLGHIYAPYGFSAATYFTKSQLTKLHKQFAHPSEQKLYNLLKRSRPEEATPEMSRILEDLCRQCDPCQRIQNASTRFKVSFGAEYVQFNERLLIDIMYLDGKPVIPIVDEGTRLSAARFLENVSTVSLWSTILECWTTIYTGLPRKILVDQGSQFGDLFISLGAINNVEVQITGIESHNSLGIGERYHQPLRNTFRKLKIAYPQRERQLLLSFAVKALNDTLGPDGHVPSALVFGEFPSPFTTSDARHPRASFESRAEIANKARREMEKEIATVKVQRALRHATPLTADAVFEVGQDVLVWRERRVENRIGEWIGPYKVHAVDQKRKLVFVKDTQDGVPRPFNVTQVKQYKTPEQINNALITDIDHGLSGFRSPREDDIYLTEILTPGDPRCSSKEMTIAKKAEIENLLKRGTFKVVLREDIPDDANVLPGRFVLTIKSTEDGQAKFKARYVIGGHRDKLKQFMVHSSQTMQLSSIRLLLALASMFRFDVWTADVHQAYPQSYELLMRDIFIKNAVPKFKLDASQCLQLLRPLYGLCESGDLWHATLDSHHRAELGMTSLHLDSALYVWIVDGLLKGLSGTYVDDLMRAGDGDFKFLARKTAERFEMAKNEHPPCNFTGFRLDVSKSDTMTIDQNDYLMTIRPMSSDAKWPDFASLRMKFS